MCVLCEQAAAAEEMEIETVEFSDSEVRDACIRRLEVFGNETLKMVSVLREGEFTLHPDTSAMWEETTSNCLEAIKFVIAVDHRKVRAINSESAAREILAAVMSGDYSKLDSLVDTIKAAGPYPHTSTTEEEISADKMRSVEENNEPG